MAQLSGNCFAFGGSSMSLDDAMALIEARLEPVAGLEAVDLGTADGRVLGQDVRAARALPAFDNSAVDGWAVSFADLDPSGRTALPIRGRIAAGGSNRGIAASGGAIRVFTGAAIPAAADTVVMQEDATLEGDLVVLPGVNRGANVRRAGEDTPAGALLLRAGTPLRPQHLALASAVGLSGIPVRTRLRVALFSTGDEVQEPGSRLRAGAIYDANRVMLRALLERAGTRVTDLGILRDDRDALRGRLASVANHHDLIVTSGGVSTGEEDHVRAAIEAAGHLVVWRMAIKPGRPVAMGLVGGKPLVGLPGNPVAAFVTFCYVARPLIARLSGALPWRPLTVPVALGVDYPKRPGVREFVRVTLVTSPDGGMEARPFGKTGSGILTSLTETDGLVSLAEPWGMVPKGTMVPFVPYGALS